MSRFVFRDHLLPMNSGAMRIVVEWYETHLRDHGVVCSRIDINKQIRIKWRREEVWAEKTVIFEVDSQEVQEQAMLSDSLDQHWLDIKPEGVFEVHGTKNYSESKCLICLERSGDKIRLHNCNCLFHKDCIETSVKYRKTCPKCFTTIYMTEVVQQNATTEKEKTK